VERGAEAMRRVREATHVYIAMCARCDRLNAVCTDLGDKQTARFVSDLIREGRHPERMTFDAYRELKWCRCNAAAPDEQQGSLL
jgi:hypothetical protein